MNLFSNVSDGESLQYVKMVLVCCVRMVLVRAKPQAKNYVNKARGI
jgi:hypothetical protein